MSLPSTPPRPQLRRPPRNYPPRKPQVAAAQVVSHAVSQISPQTSWQPSRPLQVGPAREPGGLRTLSFAALALFIFSTFGFLAETVATLASSRVPLAKVIIGFTLIGVLVSGAAVLRAMSSLLGRLILLYSAWLMLTVPLATWRGGAFEAYLGWIHSVLCFVFVATLIASFSQLRKSVFMVVLATAMVVLVGFFLGAFTDDRFSILTGTLTNANDLSIHLLLALPFCVFFIADRNAARPAKVIAWLTAFGSLAMALTTGSRTGVLIMMVFGVTLFIGASITNKLKILVCAATVAVLALLLLPASLRARYSTLFLEDATDSHGVIYSADESVALRELLLQHSVRMALQHPIFGIGMANFAGVAEKETEDTFQSTMWKQPHNVYSQIAAETGIPGLLLYLSILFMTIRNDWRVWKRTHRQPELRAQHLLAGCFMLTLFAFAASNFFATSAYSFYLPIFAALVVALERYGLPQAASGPKVVPGRS